MNKRLDVQGLRAVAVISVVLFHAGLPLPGGFIGVDVFLVISGFVISSMLLREYESRGSLDYVRFYQRRFWRIFPALAVVIAFTLTASIFFLSPFGPQQTAVITGVGSIFLAGNIAISNSTGGYFDAAAETNPLLNLWSLSVEEQFYVIFPFALVLLLAIGRKFSANRRIVGGGIVLFSVVSFAAALYGSSRTLGPTSELVFGFYSLVPRAWEFGAGVLIALFASAIRNRLSPMMSTGISVVGAGLVAVGLATISSDTPFPSAWTLLPVAGTSLLIIAGFHENSPITRVLASRPLTRIGDWSYSIYLWHWPIIVLAVLIWPHNPNVAVWAALASVVPAIVSYVFIESPLRNREKWPVVRSRAIGATLIALPLVVAVVLSAGANALWNREWSGITTQADHIAYGDCTDAEFSPEKCLWPAADSRGVILLIGDSQAYSYADGVVAAAGMRGYDVIVSSISGCPFGAVPASGNHVVDCAEWQQQVMDYALDTAPDVVLIANRSAGYTNTALGWRTIVDEFGAKATASTASRLYAESQEPVLHALSDAGIPVVIMQNIPSPPVPYEMGSYSQSTLFTQWVWNSQVESFPPEAAVDRAAESRRIETELASRFGAVLFDPFDYLCSATGCPLGIDGFPTYLDVAHLTAPASTWLGGAIAEAIDAALNKYL